MSYGVNQVVFVTEKPVRNTVSDQCAEQLATVHSNDRGFVTWVERYDCGEPAVVRCGSLGSRCVKHAPAEYVALRDAVRHFLTEWDVFYHQGGTWDEFKSRQSALLQAVAQLERLTQDVPA